MKNGDKFYTGSGYEFLESNCPAKNLGIMFVEGWSFFRDKDNWIWIRKHK